MTNPNLPPSDEVRHEAITDLVIAEDWDTRFKANAAIMRGLRAELDESTDPNEVLKPTEIKGDVIAERAQFEADFGEGQ